MNEKITVSNPTLADVQNRPEIRVSPFEKVRRAAMGPRTDASVKSKLHLYVALGALLVAWQSTCTSRGWLVWAKRNLTRPWVVYMDPSGTGTLVEAYAPGEQPPPGEVYVKAKLWEVCQLQFGVLGDTIAANEGKLTDFYYIGDALLQQSRDGQDAQKMGTSAEKIALIKANKTRDVELRNITWVTPAVKIDDSYRAVGEVFFYARTYEESGMVPSKKRAYRVTYTLSFGGEYVPGDTVLSQKLFVYNNPVILRIDKWHLEEESTGVISDSPDNNGPDGSAQVKALSPSGQWPPNPAATEGGIVAKPYVPPVTPERREPVNKFPVPSAQPQR